MRAIGVYRNGTFAGTLIEEHPNLFVFRYNDDYYNNPALPAISLTLPKTQKEYSSEYLFPFFCNMLSEGVNRRLQNTLLKVDEEDDFGLLMSTAQFDTIGTITVMPIGDR